LAGHQTTEQGIVGAVVVWLVVICTYMVDIRVGGWVGKKTDSNRAGHQHLPARPGKCLKSRASANHRSLAQLGSTIFIAKKLFKLQNKHCSFTFHFDAKIPQHKLTISILQSFIFQTV